SRSAVDGPVWEWRSPIRPPALALAVGSLIASGPPATRLDAPHASRVPGFSASGGQACPATASMLLNFVLARLTRDGGITAGTVRREPTPRARRAYNFQLTQTIGRTI